MEKKPYKPTLLVLIDFSKNAYKALKYAISMAKAVNGKIVLLYVASPKNLAEPDNMSVVRGTGIDKNKAEGQLKSIIEMIEAENLAAEYINTIGNLNSKLNEYTQLLSPSLIVLGKSNLKETHLSEITEFLLNESDDNVLIVESDTEFNESTHILVECNEGMLNDYNSNFLFWLHTNTKTPLCIFINKKKRSKEEFSFPKSWEGIQNVNHKICYKNNPYFSLTTSIKNHISDEKIDLVCIGRKRGTNTLFSKLLNQPNTTADIIKHTHIPILIMGKTS